MSSIFGSEFDEIWPKSLPKYTEFGLNLLRSCENIKKPKNVNFNEVCKQSSEFSIKVRRLIIFQCSIFSNFSGI